MNKSSLKNKLQNSALIVLSVAVQGCFESASPPSAPPPTQQPSTPSQKPTPLSKVSNVNFRIPEGTTRIISSYEQRETNNWSDARNWRSGFYGNGDLLACGDYNYVPCLQKEHYIPHSISIEGECFVNDSVDFESLSLRDNSTLVIPKGVCVKISTGLGGPRGKHIIDGVLQVPCIDMLGGSEATFSGVGTFETTDKTGSSIHLGGTITVSNLMLPGLRVSPISVLKANEKLHLNIQNGCFSHLLVDSICVSNRLDIGFMLIKKGHNDDLRVNHLNVRETGMIIFGRRSPPYNIQKLSFEPKSRICFEFLLSNSDNFDESGQWIPRRITGILDATNLRVAFYPEFKVLEPKGGGKVIGGRVDLLIAEQGVIGISDWLNEQNRRTIAGITNPRNSEQFPSGSTHYLLRTDDRALYATALTGAGISLFSGDHTFQRLKNDHPNADHNEHLGLNRAQYRELNKICDALFSQAESIYENATAAGIERYLDIQLTVDLKERAQKVLGLIDITKYLDQRNDVTQEGLQAISDIFAKARLTSSPFGQGITVVEIPLHGLASSRSGGIVFRGTDTRITLALHNSSERHSLPISGLELNNRISAKWGGLFQCVGSNINEPNRSFTLSVGTLYKATPNMELSAVVGGSYFGSTVDSLRADEATPRSSMMSLRSELHLLWKMGDHNVNSGLSVDYLPIQTVTVNIPDFGIAVNDIKIVDKWNATMRLGYAYSIAEGAALNGNIQLNLGDSQALSGNIGVAINR